MHLAALHLVRSSLIVPTLALLIAAAPVAAQSVTPNTLIISKGQSADVLVDTGPTCDAFISTFFPLGAPKIVKFTPEASSLGSAGLFSLRGMKGGTTTVGFRLVGEDLALGTGGDCDEVIDVFAMVTVLDPASAGKEYQKASKLGFKTLKTDNKALLATLDSALDGLIADLQTGGTDGISACGTGRIFMISALNAMEQTSRSFLEDLAAQGVTILSEGQFAQDMIPTTLLPGGGGAHDKVLAQLGKLNASTHRKVTKLWNGFTSSVEKITATAGTPHRITSILVPLSIPAVNAPTAGDAAATAPAPETFRLLLAIGVVRAGGAGEILLGGLAEAQNDYVVRLTGPDGFADTQAVSVVGTGVWILDWNDATAPGSYVATVEANDDPGVPFTVTTLSYPSEP